jgi:hypothetical protein
LEIETFKERAEDLAQVVEHLPSKYKALSSNPNTAGKKETFKGSLYIFRVALTFQ